MPSATRGEPSVEASGIPVDRPGAVPARAELGRRQRPGVVRRLWRGPGPLRASRPAAVGDPVDVAVLAAGQQATRSGSHAAGADPGARVALEPGAVGLRRRILGLEHPGQHPLPVGRQPAVRQGVAGDHEHGRVAQQCDPPRRPAAGPEAAAGAYRRQVRALRFRAPHSRRGRLGLGALARQDGRARCSRRRVAPRRHRARHHPGPPRRARATASRWKCCAA